MDLQALFFLLQPLLTLASGKTPPTIASFSVEPPYLLVLRKLGDCFPLWWVKFSANSLLNSGHFIALSSLSDPCSSTIWSWFEGSM